MKITILTSRSLLVLVVALALRPQGTAQQPRYKLIDIGTLGGPTSFTSVNGPGLPLLNNSGTVSAWADTSQADPNAPNFCFQDCFLDHAFKWKNGVLTDLGALPGNNSSAVGAISSRGWSVGQSQNGVFDPVFGFPEVEAVLWTDNGIVDLGTLGGNESLASSLNNEGQVVGISQNAVPDQFSLFGLATQTRAFIWQRGQMSDLGTLGGPDAVALALNDHGQVVGFSYTNDTPNVSTGMPTIEPFLWQQGRMTALGSFGGTMGGPGAEGSVMINNRGQAIGTSNLPGDQFAHAFIWQKGAMNDLGTLGGNNSYPLWINDTGEIVGEADIPGPENALGQFPHHAFLWHHGIMTDLGTLGSTSHAESINDRGQVIGRSRLGSEISALQHAFLWENGGPMIDLNTLISPHDGLQLIDAVDINERGEILVVQLPAGVQAGDGVGRLGLLIPCPGDEASCNDTGEGSTSTGENLRLTALPKSMDNSKPSNIMGWRKRLPRAGKGQH